MKRLGPPLRAPLILSFACGALLAGSVLFAGNALFAGSALFASSTLFADDAHAAAHPCDALSCLDAQVVGVADGDTVTLLVERSGGPAQVRLRLTEIDTPERAQPWGARARQALAGKLFRRQVRVASEGEDRYGRLLGRVYLDGRDINREMVREGHAWVYRQYSSDIWLLEDERLAREDGAGIWSLPESQRVPPWEWRRGGRRPNAPAIAAASTAGSFACGEKAYCREMLSCAEARHYLNQCGLSSLDGDGDGMPCERICRGSEQP